LYDPFSRISDKHVSIKGDTKHAPYEYRATNVANPTPNCCSACKMAKNGGYEYEQTTLLLFLWCGMKTINVKKNQFLLIISKQHSKQHIYQMHSLPLQHRREYNKDGQS